MKNLVFAALVLSASLAMTASGQVKSVAAANNQPASKISAANQIGGGTSGHTLLNATRARVLGPETKGVPVGSIVSSGMFQPRAKPDFNNHTEAARLRRAKPPAVVDSFPQTTPDPLPDNPTVGTSNLKSSSASVSPASNEPNVSPTIAVAATQVYRVGARDVLDIKLSELASKSSTLFTVLEDGVLEYPLAGSPMVVAGLTTPGDSDTVAATNKNLRQPYSGCDSPRLCESRGERQRLCICPGHQSSAPGSNAALRGTRGSVNSSGSGPVRQ